MAAYLLTQMLSSGLLRMKEIFRPYLQRYAACIAA